jgi:beta-aspartyl-peptidase (threonine type)
MAVRVRIHKMLMVLRWLENNIDPETAAQKAMALFDDPVDIGLSLLTQTQFALNSRNGMACTHLTEIG